MTKPICVVSALILVDRGLLSLEDPVSKWIPSFSNGQVFVSGDENNPITEPVDREITVRDLMMHTSGLSYGIFGGSPVDKILQNNVGKDWVNFYRNTSLEVLSVLVELRYHFSQEPSGSMVYQLMYLVELLKWYPV
jgi:CubicO group peptidase (beta-lactamase class C family)